MIRAKRLNRPGTLPGSPLRPVVLLLVCVQVVLLSIAGRQAVPAQTKPPESFPGKSWQNVSSLERAGWSKERLAAAHAYADSDSIHTSAVMIVQGGRVVDQWGDFDKKIDCYSIRKSLLSALYGIYSAEGVIDVNQTLEQLGIDDSPDPLTKEEKQARIVDLLRARSGVYHPVDFETASMQKSRPARGSHAPGSFWYYNNWDFNVLGTIFEKKTGLKIGDAFYQRIAKPIGMEDFQPSDVFYFGGPLSIHPAYHFEITARDMARFGLLYLRHGRWSGKQIVPEAWIEKSSHASEMVKSDGADHGGYEYLWWVDYGGVHFPEVSLPGIYSARGNGAHYIFIIPTLDMVIVHRTDNDPPVKDAKTITEIANRASPASENRAQFGHLVKLILDARNP
ncbi:MAG TPA: serine hydrolase [Chthoniobacterales bacterium]|nr:serine hydrolase [Chthoniobacterales bacterium]